MVLNSFFTNRTQLQTFQMYYYFSFEKKIQNDFVDWKKLKWSSRKQRIFFFAIIIIVAVFVVVTGLMCKTKIFKANKIGGAVIYIEHVLSERETSKL